MVTTLSVLLLMFLSVLLIAVDVRLLLTLLFMVERHQRRHWSAWTHDVFAIDNVAWLLLSKVGIAVGSLGSSCKCNHNEG